MCRFDRHYEQFCVEQNVGRHLTSPRLLQNTAWRDVGIGAYLWRYLTLFAIIIYEDEHHGFNRITPSATKANRASTQLVEEASLEATEAYANRVVHIDERTDL